jgi:hypothetical protein
MRSGLRDHELKMENNMREAFVDFLLGVLDLDPQTRWTPRQALRVRLKCIAVSGGLGPWGLDC